MWRQKTLGGDDGGGGGACEEGDPFFCGFWKGSHYSCC